MQSSEILSGTTELGSLIATSNDESQFVGSSSGVYFINTVRQAFAKSLGPLDNSLSSPEFPAAEETLVGPESLTAANASRDKATSPTAENDIGSRKSWSYDHDVARILGEAPNLEDARQLMMMYFKVWHPIFPFLHGPTFLQEMEALYSVNTRTEGQPKVSQHHDICWTTIFQCAFNLAALSQPDRQLWQKSKIQCAADFPKLAGILLYRHDMLSLQALLVMQLYLVATMSLHNASLIGGFILRSTLHSGLHRCPYRYKQLTSHDRHLRKRIFWCAYAIDRYLSQALGLPLGIQDSDIDVCLPGNLECHAPADPGHLLVSSPPQDEYNEPSTSRVSAEQSASNDKSHLAGQYTQTTTEGDPHNGQQNYLSREATLASYVIYGKLTGRALELFHKSIKNRQIRRSSVLYLVSDVHKWWNNLPSSLQQQNNHDEGDNDSFDLSPFFAVLYEHLILCINRPYLSLDPSSPDFCSSLQTCIGAARNILSSLKTQLHKGQALFWPGLLSAAYMSGLIIAFACQLKQYVFIKGCQEIRGCLEILQTMSNQWKTAKHCHTALSFLLLNIQRTNEQAIVPASITPDENASSPQIYQNKRQKTTHTFETQSSHNSSYFNDDRQRHLQAASLSPAPSSSSQNPETRVSATPPFESPHSVRPSYQPRNAAATLGYYEQNHPESSINPSPYSPLLMMGTSPLDGRQWPGGPATMTTNFDLNMTDLFQGSTWDPSVFDAFAQGQLPSQGDL